MRELRQQTWWWHDDNMMMTWCWYNDDMMMIWWWHDADMMTGVGVSRKCLRPANPPGLHRHGARTRWKALDAQTCRRIVQTGPHQKGGELQTLRWIFSKYSSPLDFLYKLTMVLTFEKFLQKRASPIVQAHLRVLPDRTTIMLLKFS